MSICSKCGNYNHPSVARCERCDAPLEGGNPEHNQDAGGGAPPQNPATAAAPGYPLRYDVQYSEELSRWLIFVKWLLAIPHFLILYALGLAANVVTFIAFFAILFTKRYPRGLFNFVVNVNRWNANVLAYYGLFRDEYPPFSWEAGQYAVAYEVDYPEQLNRWLPLVKWLLAIPHFIVLIVLFIAAFVAWFIAWFAILFTRRFPRGLFNYIVGVIRWNYRVSAYTGLLRDEYPPFSLS